ncbi:MAG: hypothetical protein GY782_03260 [Gammaproteobacteria bacterium]|nr:hypothetical protein [Gammaproteobacteria bacterium]
MVEIMVSKRPWRVYDDYFKNSRYCFGIALPIKSLLLQADLHVAYHGCDGMGLRKIWRWRLIARLLWGLSEHGGGKHPLGDWLDSNTQGFSMRDDLSGLIVLIRLNGAIHHDNTTQTLSINY